MIIELGKATLRPNILFILQSPCSKSSEYNLKVNANKISCLSGKIGYVNLRMRAVIVIGMQI